MSLRLYYRYLPLLHRYIPVTSRLLPSNLPWNQRFYRYINATLPFLISLALLFLFTTESSRPNYTITLLHYYTITLLHYYTITLLHNYTITQLHNYTITQLHNYTITQLHNYTITQLHNYTISQLQSPAIYDCCSSERIPGTLALEMPCTGRYSVNSRVLKTIYLLSLARVPLLECALSSFSFSFYRYNVKVDIDNHLRYTDEEYKLHLTVRRSATQYAPLQPTPFLALSSSDLSIRSVKARHRMMATEVSMRHWWCVKLEAETKQEHRCPTMEFVYLALVAVYRQYWGCSKFHSFLSQACPADGWRVSGGAKMEVVTAEAKALGAVAQACGTQQLVVVRILSRTCFEICIWMLDRGVDEAGLWPPCTAGSLVLSIFLSLLSLTTLYISLFISLTILVSTDSFSCSFCLDLFYIFPTVISSS